MTWHDAVAMRARLVHATQHHHLAGFELDARWERRALARLQRRSPRTRSTRARRARGRLFQTAAPGCDTPPAFFRDGTTTCVDVVHWNLLSGCRSLLYRAFMRLFKSGMSIFSSESGCGEKLLCRFGKGRERKRDRHGTRPIGQSRRTSRCTAEGVEDPGRRWPARAPSRGSTPWRRRPNTAPRMRCPKYSRARTGVERHHAAVGRSRTVAATA